MFNLQEKYTVLVIVFFYPFVKKKKEFILMSAEFVVYFGLLSSSLQLIHSPVTI